MSFKDFWKKNPYATPRFEKAMSQTELERARKIINDMQEEGRPSSMIIKRLGDVFPKLRPEWKAARAYWTETKKIDTKEVKEFAGDLGFKHYKVILSPSACPLCRKKSDNGSKVFDAREVVTAAKSYGKFVPWHPNCYCIAIPLAD
jgi:hypothetical protein